MIKVQKEFKFEASHILPRHAGKCSRLHGHSWRLRVALWGVVTSESGFVLDFTRLKDLVQPVVDRFDHRHLNAFVRYPTSENIAIHIAHELRPSFFPIGTTGRYKISVSETKSTWAEWDSDSQYCQDVFDKFLLDSAPEAFDAGWRSPTPVIPVVDDVDDLETSVTALAHSAFYKWQEENTVLEQLRLYRASMGEPGAIFEELKHAGVDIQK